jgi:Skp family chaperone for outer membrane proteins
MEFLMGWGNLLAEVAAYIGLKKLREHSDQYTKLELELKKEFEKPYAERDDLKFVSIKRELAIIRAAFERDMKLGADK